MSCLSEFNSNIEIKKGSERNFGLTFAIIFLVIGLYPMLEGEFPRIWALFFALSFVVLAFLTPKVLSTPNMMWFKLGTSLGAIIAPIIMTVVYLIAVAPVGIIARLMGKDLIKQKLDKNAKSYWIKRNQPVGSMRNQF